MTDVGKIVRNFALSLTGQILTWSSTLILMIAYGRFLGDFKFGELYLALTFVLLLGTPIDSGSGYDIQTTRVVAEEPERAPRFLANILFVKFATWLLVYAVANVMAIVLGYNPEVRALIAICGVTLLTGAIANTFASFQYAFQRAVYPAVGTVLEKGLSALIGVLILRAGAGVRPMALVLLGGSLVSLLWQGVWIVRLVGFRFDVDWPLMRNLVRSNIPFLLYGLLGVMYYRIDVVLLSLLTNDKTVGWYGAGYRLFDTLSFFPSMMLSIFYPVFTRVALSSETRLRVAGEKLVSFSLLLCMPVCTALIVAAPNIISFLYHNPDFVNTIPSLQALAPGLVFIYVNMALSIVFLTTRQDKKIPTRAAAALVFNLSINLLLIPHFLHVGAAIATTLTEVLLLFINLSFIPRHLRPIGSVATGLKSVGASLVMAVAIWSLRDASILIILPVGAIVYVVAATLMRAVPADDVRTILATVRRRSRGRAVDDAGSPDAPAALASVGDGDAPPAERMAVVATADKAQQTTASHGYAVFSSLARARSHAFKALQRLLASVRGAVAGRSTTAGHPVGRREALDVLHGDSDIVRLVDPAEPVVQRAHVSSTTAAVGPDVDGLPLSGGSMRPGQP